MKQTPQSQPYRSHPMQTDTEALLARLLRKAPSGQHTIGSACISSTGEFTSIPSVVIMMDANPDGHAAAALIREQAAQLAAARAEADRLAEAVTLARDVFARYATMHLAKCTTDGYAKGRVNHDLSRDMSAALAARTDPAPDQALGEILCPHGAGPNEVCPQCLGAVPDQP